MTYQKVFLLLVMSSSLCVASKEAEKKVQLTEADLIAILEKAEQKDPNFRRIIDRRMFSRKGLTAVLNCVNNGYENCDHPALVMLEDSEHKCAKALRDKVKALVRDKVEQNMPTFQEAMIDTIYEPIIDTIYQDFFDPSYFAASKKRIGNIVHFELAIQTHTQILYAYLKGYIFGKE